MIKLDNNEPESFQAASEYFDESVNFLQKDMFSLSQHLRTEGATVSDCNALLINAAKGLSAIKSIQHLVQERKDQLLSRTAPSLKVVHSAPRGFENDRLLSVPQVAKVLGCTRPTVYNKHMQNGLKVIYPTGKKGNKKVRESDLNAYLAQLG